MKNRNLTSIVFDDIRNKILNYRLLPGNRISDTEIAEAMNISRSPVRQALFRLAEHGLIESRHNRGFIVKVFSAKEIEDLHVLREALELSAIDLVVKNMTRDTAQGLQHAVDRLKPLIDQNDIAEITRIDWQFHNLIIKGGGNTLMIGFYRSLQDRIKISFPHLQTPGPAMWEIYDEHKQILDNILYKNTAGARYAMSSHLRGALEINLTATRKHKSQTP
jgi:DNA-binding GntR family transcriptional regulator